jgi:serine/threonine-protein kinase
MVSRHTPCDASRLRALLDASASEDGGSGDLAQHLEHCEKCRGELEAMAGGRWWEEVRPFVRPEPGDEPGAPTQAGPAAATGDPELHFLAPPDRPGHLGRFGPYEVLGVLGKGGMGVVLKAWEPALRRTVAIKVLAPQLATCGAARQRFTREAQAAAAVVHTHVVAIHSIDTDNASGLPYLVMPVIAGCSLQERIARDGPLDVPAVLRIGMQAASGLAAAHAQGIIHRDIKPANILLENGVERVVLTDFGLARAADDASRTQSGVIAGTPEYMSPEQARGEPVDHRSDLFSLGSVLYAMCAGRPPFRAPSALAVLRRVADERPRPLRELNSDVPEALAAVIDKLHANDPADRWQTAAEVAEVLGQQLADLQGPGCPVAATPVPPAPPPRRRRWRPALVAGLIVVACGLLFAGVSGLNRSGAPRLMPFQVVFGNPDETVVGSGRPETRTYDLKGFTGIEVNGPFSVELKQGRDFKVAVTAADNLFEHLQVEKDGAKLRVGFKGKNARLRLSREQPLRAAVTLPILEALHLNGAARATAEEFKAGRPLRFHLNGASRLKGTFQAADVSIDANGASTVQLAGSGKNVRLKANGASRLALAEFAASGDQLIIDATGASSVTLKGSVTAGALQAVRASQLHLRDLTLAAADVTLVGASRASVRVKEMLTYSVSGASHLDYYGDPKIGKSSKQGASHVSHKE